MIKKQYCQQKEHYESEVASICVLKECNQKIRFACDQCLLQKIHHHGLSNESHIIQVNDFIADMPNDFLSLDNIKIDEFLFDIYGIQFDEEFNDYLKNAMNVNKKQELTYQINKQEQLNFKFEEYIRWENNEKIYTFQISPNEQLIAFGGENNLLTIIDMTNKIIVKEIIFNCSINFCKFSNDSKLIYVGDYYGFLNAYDIQQNYELIYRNQIYRTWRYTDDVYDMKLIQNEQVITCVAMTSIIIYDIKNDNQLLKIDKCHQDKIFQIEYDSTHEVIISCSRDKSIKFFKLKDEKNIINKKNAHSEEVFQIQQMNNQLFSRSKMELKQWLINYSQKSLNIIRKIIENENIYNFIIQDKIFIKVYQRHLNICDSNFKIISQHDHFAKKIWDNLNSNQPSTLNYILIMGINNIKILKRVN